MISITINREEIDRLIDAVSMLFGYNSFDKYVNDRINYKINKDKRYSYDNGSMRKRIITDGYSEIMLLRFSSGLFRSITTSSNFSLNTLSITIPPRII